MSEEAEELVPVNLDTLAGADNRQHRNVSASRMKKQRARLTEVLKRMDDRVLDEIQRRSEMTNQPDGWGAGTSYDGMPHGSSDSTSTERAAIALAEGKSRDYDPQQMSCYLVDDAFAQMAKSVEKANRAWDVVLNASEALRGRQSTLGLCYACLRDDVPNTPKDRIRSGYCHACFVAWCRTDQGHGRRDRLAFERDRRALRVMKDGEATYEPGYSVDDLDALVDAGTLPANRKEG